MHNLKNSKFQILTNHSYSETMERKLITDRKKIIETEENGRGRGDVSGEVIVKVLSTVSRVNYRVSKVNYI